MIRYLPIVFHSICYNSCIEEDLLGEGFLGSVYKAEFPNGPELNMHLQASSISNIIILTIVFH